MDDPTGNVCRRFFWACQDANYNVLGLVNHIGLLTERYEYSPYGERKVLSRGWLLSDLNGDGSVCYAPPGQPAEGNNSSFAIAAFCLNLVKEMGNGQDTPFQDTPNHALLAGDPKQGI